MTTHQSRHQQNQGLGWFWVLGVKFGLVDSRGPGWFNGAQESSKPTSTTLEVQQIEAELRANYMT